MHNKKFKKKKYDGTKHQNRFFLKKKCWVGHKVRSGSSITSYRRTQRNFLANPVYFLHYPSQGHLPEKSAWVLKEGHGKQCSSFGPFGLQIFIERKWQGFLLGTLAKNKDESDLSRLQASVRYWSNEKYLRDWRVTGLRGLLGI